MDKRERPQVLAGVTTEKKTGCGSIYITVNGDEQGTFEIFATLGKAGGCAVAQLEALTRMVTLGLRSGAPLWPYVAQLGEIRCPSPYMFPKKERALSCADAIAHVLEGELDDGGKKALKAWRKDHEYPGAQYQGGLDDIRPEDK